MWSGWPTKNLPHYFVKFCCNRHLCTYEGVYPRPKTFLSNVYPHQRDIHSFFKFIWKQLDSISCFLDIKLVSTVQTGSFSFDLLKKQKIGRQPGKGFLHKISGKGFLDKITGKEKWNKIKRSCSTSWYTSDLHATHLKCNLQCLTFDNVSIWRVNITWSNVLFWLTFFQNLIYFCNAID